MKIKFLFVFLLLFLQSCVIFLDQDTLDSCTKKGGTFNLVGTRCYVPENAQKVDIYNVNDL